jgi:hypothetical protein
LVVLWWRRSGGTAYSLRQLLPGRKGLKVFGGLLLAWYLFWGFVIKPKSIPTIFPGQLTVWILYAALLTMFYRCILRSRQVPSPDEPGVVGFTWRGFVFCFGFATAVTTAARLWLHRFAIIQIALFFTFYIVAGLALLAGAVRYATKGPPTQGGRINTS